MDKLEELKNIELEILKAFIEVCGKLNLKYYVVQGTLLGAVRHKGFIPWDDDIDVAMPRKDYEIFLKEAKNFLPEHYFVQNYITDPNVPFVFSKLRDSNTTFIESSMRKFNINHGIFIDIFPIDYYPSEKKQQDKIRKQNLIYKRIIAKKFTIRHLNILQRGHRLVKKIFTFFISYKILVKKLDDLYKSIKETDTWINYNGPYQQKEKMTIDSFGEGILLDFEGLKVNAPLNYDEYLTNIYGDYMTLPPENKRIGHHYNEIIDTNKSYKEYNGKLDK